MTVALIPALSGSTRVEDKNLILINGYPAIYYVVRSAIESGVFDRVYVDSDLTQLRPLVESLGATFKERIPQLGGTACLMSNSSATCRGDRCQVADHFIYSFMNSVDTADNVVMIHTTSPLISPEYIRQFVGTFVKTGVDSQFAVVENYIESFLQDTPINFSPRRKQPTQDLIPVTSISWAICAWKKEEFIDAYQVGPTFNGDVGYVNIPKMDALELDSPQDLYIIEACLAHKRSAEDVGKFKFNPDLVLGIESNLEELISRDGSPLTDSESNKRITTLADAKEALGGRPGTVPVVLSDKDQVGLICQYKGEGCRKHFHASKAEFWFIVEGCFQYELWNYTNYGDLNKSPDEIILAEEGSVVFLPKGTVHVITCVSEVGIRLACGERDMAHIYVK